MDNSKIECKMDTTRLNIKKICEYCGEAFIAQKISTKHCSHKCTSASYKSSKRTKLIQEASGKSEISSIERKIEKIKNKEFLKVAETATLLGVCKQTIYNMINCGRLKAVRVSERVSIIRRKDIDDIFIDPQANYTAQPKAEIKPITEFYTLNEIKKKFNVKDTWIFKIAKEKQIPKTLRRGKSYYSKSHVDRHFKKSAIDPSIVEWYTVVELQDQFNMTLAAIYSFAYDNAIPKKKDGRTVLYSKPHFDKARSKIRQKPEYYTVQEAMEKFNVTRDTLYNQVKYHNIPKIKDGKFIKISKPELDKLFEQAIII